MKNTSKILALVLALVMMFAMASMLTVSAAEETITVYFQNNWLWTEVSCHYWGDGFGTEWPGAEMTKVATWEGNDVYSISIPANCTGIIFNGVKNDGTGNRDQTPNITSGLVDSAAWKMNWNNGNEAIASTYTPDAHSHAYDSTGLCECGERAVLTVAGDNTALFGTEWDVSNAANNLSYDESTGLWSKSYTNTSEETIWPNFKVVQDNSWGKNWGAVASGQGTDANANAWAEVPAGATLTITINYATDALVITVEVPHTHVWSDATCTEPKMCECGETEGEALGHDMVTDAAKAPTCTETGLTEGSHCSRCDAATTAQEVVPVIDHSYAEGVCSVCGASDPDYVAPLPEGTYVFESSKLDAAAAGDFADGTVVKVDDYFSLILGAKSKIDSSSKTWKEEDWGELAYKSGQRLYLGGKTSTTANAIVFTTSKAATVTVWWVSNGEPNEDGTGSRPIGILDSEGNILAQDTTGVAKNALYISTFEIPAAGTYYLGNMVDNNYFFKVEVVEKDVEAPHVNTLVVGDTNKIVIGDSAVDNGYGYLVESVVFVADEKAHYEFVGEGLTILVYDLSGNNVCGFSGKADLEAGTYLVCVAANTVGTKGEYNVAVTKSEIVVPEHVNKLVVGENNKIVVSGETLNQNNNPIEWVTFVVEEKAHYAFTSETENALVFIFDASFNILCGGTGAAVLEPGTYLICVGNGAVGDIYVQVTKTEIPTECEHNWVYMNCTLCGAANPNFAHNLLVVGENKVVCNEYHLVDTTGHGNPYQFTLLTVAEDGLYIFTCDKLIGVTIFTTEINDPKADFTAGTGTSWTVYEAGKAELKAGTYYIGFIYVDGVGEYTVNIEKHDEHNHEAVVTAPTCTEAGYTTHTCVCGDTYTDSEVAALGHDYAEGVCSRCEAKDPDYVAPQPPVDEKPDDGEVEEPVQLNFFQKIVKLIKDLLAKFLGFFKRFGL